MTVSGPWRILAHHRCIEQLSILNDAVEALAEADPSGYAQHPKARILARVRQLILDDIPRDPLGPQFRLGKTLGGPYGHWFRAKWFGRFRLFFRCDSRTRTIVYAWMNDENTLRKSGSRSDPYIVFRGMLKGDEIPDDWTTLFRNAIGVKPR
ncbi:MAG: type II toxin-antitoxin system YhaV family toxin [Alphaproteobacteria bacterium]|nr:type II toxin-antitoxin system YhaV family toxin [Alphaproteobacteria bacterium]